MRKPLFDQAEKLIMFICKLLLIEDVCFSPFSILFWQLIQDIPPTFKWIFLLIAHTCLCVYVLTIALRYVDFMWFKKGIILDWKFPLI